MADWIDYWSVDFDYDSKKEIIKRFILWLFFPQSYPRSARRSGRDSIVAA
jgi:hypothetical protein